MKPDTFLREIVDPMLRKLAEWPSITIPLTAEARVLVLAIAGQESNWTDRRQIGGPARSYWQFERFGGVAEVFERMPRQLSAVCASIDVPFNPNDVFEAMAWNDTLACAMARLLLWPYPGALPALGDREGAWGYYLKVWRPGAPHRERWTPIYDQSLALVKP